MTDESKHSQRIIVTSTKSVGLSLILTFLLGPIGMFYSTLWGGLIMALVAGFVWLVTLGMGLILIWPICMIWGAFATASYNKKLFRQIEQ